MDAERLQRLVAEVALTELGEDERTRERGLKEMRDWISQHPNITNCRTDDNFLLRFLRTKKFDIVKAQKMLHNFLNLKNVLPPILLGDHDIGLPSIDEFMCNGFYFGSPQRDDNGRQVIMVILGRLDLTQRKYTYDMPARTIILSNLSMLEDEASQVLGYTYVFDAANTSMAHIALWPSPVEFIHFIKSGDSAMPMRNKEIHILNLPFYMTCFLNILKAALTKKLRQRIVIHSSLESLHEKVNPRVLPSEYGGDTSMSDMIDLWKAELNRKHETVRALNDIKVAMVDKKESKRRDTRELKESFRNLQVD